MTKSRKTRVAIDGKNYRFISCKPSADYATSREKHIAPCSVDYALPSWVTTLCGSTGTYGAWQYCYAKPFCSACVAKFLEIGGDVDTLN